MQQFFLWKWLHSCCVSFLTVSLYLWAPSQLASGSVKKSSAEDYIFMSTMFLPFFLHVFSYVCQRIPFLLCFSVALLLSLSFWAECIRQSQGPYVSTPLTLREPCLHLSTRVHGCTSAASEPSFQVCVLLSGWIDLCKKIWLLHCNNHLKNSFRVELMLWNFNRE